MYDLTYTLLSEGTTDQALIPIIDWALSEKYPHIAFTPSYADLSLLTKKPETLADKIREAVRLYPCHVLFIHRDTDKQEAQERYEEIENAYRESGLNAEEFPYVRIVPKKMTEAWLLIDEMAIRKAAGKPNGRVRLDMPHLHELEGIPDPKARMYDLLRVASDATGRRADKLKKTGANIRNLAQMIKENGGFEPLRNLSAFQDFESGIANLQFR